MERSRESLDRIERWFLLSAVLILGTTAAAKLGSIPGNAGFLGVPDPVFGIQFRHILLAVGSLELVIAVICLSGLARQLGLPLIAWLSSSFIFYRLAVWWGDAKRPCPCLGSLGDSLHMTRDVADTLMKMALAYLLVGSYGLLILAWRRRSTLVAGNPGGSLKHPANS